VIYLQALPKKKNESGSEGRTLPRIIRFTRKERVKQ